MRSITGVALAVALFVSLAGPRPARADGPDRDLTAKLEQALRDGDLVVKVALQHLDTISVIRMMTGSRKGVLPAGIKGLLAYPLDGSLLIQGEPQAVERMKEAVRIIDVVVEEREGTSQAVVAIRHARPEAVREAVLALPKSGFARLEGRNLVLTGSATWVRQSLGPVLEAELAPAAP